MSFNGYSNTYSNSNVNNNFVNASGSENIGIFPTNDTGSYLGLVGAKTGVIGANSIAAVANGVTSGNCMKGGKKHIKGKIKNISKMYKMKKSKRQIRSLKRKIMTKYRLKRKNSKNKTKKNYKRGGGNAGQSGQFQNNLPINQSYSLGGVIDAKNSALANPPPYEVVSGKWAIMDNFNKYTGLGFSSKGH
jgi:hypothetical protein